MTAGKHDQYTNQVAILLEGGNQFPIEPTLVGLKANAEDRGWSHRTCRIGQSDSLATAARKLRSAFTGFWNEGTRVYLIGHGSWKNHTVGTKWGPDTAAAMLRSAGMCSVAVVSLICCKLARDEDTPSDGIRVNESMSSFAAQFHRHLKNLGIETYVFGRTYNVGVDLGSGSKWTTKEGRRERHRDRSKILFGWKDDKQIRKDAYTDAEIAFLPYDVEI